MGIRPDKCTEQLWARLFTLNFVDINDRCETLKYINTQSK